MKRLANHILECIQEGNVSICSDWDNWDGKTYIALSSKDIYERDLRIYSDCSMPHSYGHNSILNTKVIKNGDWVLNRPYRQGWIWNRQWNFFLRKWKDGSFIQVTGLTQAEKNMLGDAWIQYGVENLVKEEINKVDTIKSNYKDSTGWWP